MGEPERDGAWAWMAAVSGDAAAQAGVVEVSGAGLAFSSSGCLCRDLLEPECGAARAIVPQGYRVCALEGRAVRRKAVRERIAASLRRGLLVPWFRGEREGVIVDACEPALRTVWASLDGQSGEERVDPDGLEGARLYLIRRAPSQRAPRLRREVHQLLEAVTLWYAPHAHGGHCALCEGSDLGLAAIARAMAEVRAGATSPSNVSVARVRHRLWMRRISDARSAAEALGGRSRSRYANRMRYAAECHDAALGALAGAGSWPAAGAPDGSRLPDPEQVRSALESVRRRMEEACGWLLEAACIRAQLPSHFVDLLRGAPNEPIAEADVGDLVYLARAGSVPFRRLAARRLAGRADDRGVSSTLRQLLFDSDEVTALFAAHALLSSAQRASSLGFLDAYLHRPAPSAPRPFSIRAELLFDAALTEPDRAAACVREAGDAWRADFGEAGAARLARLLGDRRRA